MLTSIFGTIIGFAIYDLVLKPLVLKYVVKHPGGVE